MGRRDRAADGGVFTDVTRRFLWGNTRCESSQRSKQHACRDQQKLLHFDPGPPAERRAYYRAARQDADYEPLQAHQIPDLLQSLVASNRLTFPRTGLPCDPYALRPHHLDAARAILDAAIEALDRRMTGALTKGKRHRREPVRLVYPNGPDSAH